MTRIQTPCPKCDAAVVVGIDDVVLGEVAGRPTYVVECSRCGTVSAKPTDATGVQLLMTAGATLSAPPVRHPEAPAEGARLTHDDLLDLHLLLQQEGWFERLHERDRTPR